MEKKPNHFPGQLVIVVNSTTSGIVNGSVGIVTKCERIGDLFEYIYWVMLNGEDKPLWEWEIKEYVGADK